jgi:outer membrane protein insertion porin family
MEERKRWCWKLCYPHCFTSLQLIPGQIRLIFMQVSKAAIMTLASVIAGNFSESVIAAPTNTSAPSKTTSSIVVPVIEVNRERVETIAQPENGDLPQFSQNTVNVQSSSSNNSTVMGNNVGIGRQGSDEKASVPIPVPMFSAAREKAPVPIPVPAIANRTAAKPVTPKKAPVASPTAAKPLTPVKKPSVPVPSPTPPVNDENLVVPAIDIQIVGATQELQDIIRQVIKTQVGGETSKTQLQKDIAAILETKLFVSARVNSTTTKDGLRIVYQVQPLVVRSLQLSGAKALTYKVVLEPFQSQINQPVSPSQLEDAVKKINKWYKDNGYSLARVVSILPDEQGIFTVNVAEGLVSDIKFKFVSENGEDVDSKGKPVVGRTKTDFIRKQLKLKAGDIFKDDVVRKDVQQLYASGLFESVNVNLEGDATKTDVIYQLKETGARAINVGGSYNADQGILGTLNYQDRNVGGINDTLSANLQLGRRDFLFDSSFNSPYRITDPNRNGYTINVFRKRGLSDTFDGDIKLLNGDRIREGKVGGSVSFQRPIDDWDASLGFNYTRVSIRDRDGKISSKDEKGNPLTLSGTGIDDLATVSFTATKDQRDNPLNPTNGSILKLSTEQSVPIGNGTISMNRLQANYSKYTPVQVYKSKQPQVFALNVQAGTVLGDLPPYESFNIGGPNSVRGYDSGDIGSGRTYVLASAEYRFPILQALGGVFFADLGSDLGSGDTVPGNPAGVRNKPGIGFGYGAGVRFNSPLGLLRADYGINDQGESRLHFGIGQRF